MYLYSLKTTSEMKVHKLDIDDFSEIDYELIAINTTAEDYLLAFLINQELKLAFKRNKTDILSSGNSENIGFSRYGFEDHHRNLYWTLVQNQKWTNTQTNSWLFEQTQQKDYLLPEFKHVDYFLKIECWEEDTAELLNKLKKINKVSAVFPVDIQNIKSKNNLIF